MASYKDYKSISAAKKAGSLYYTNKDGKVMAAVYAEDLKKPLKVVKPKMRPSSGSIKVEVLLPGSDRTIADAIEKGKNIKPTKPKPKPLRSSLKPKPRPSSVKRVTKALDKGSPNLKKTKKNKKIDPEVKSLGTLTILQIQKKPGVMTMMEELEVKKANLENRIAKAKKAGTKDLGAEASLRVIKKRIKDLKSRNK